MAGKKNTILNEPKYEAFMLRYRGPNGFSKYVLELSRHKPTWQQMDLILAIESEGCRVACASGHGTGKSWVLAWFVDWHLRVYPHGNLMITASNLEQVRSVIWKYLDEVIEDVEKVYPWMTGFFVKETKRYYECGNKDNWYAVPKTAGKSKPETLAGQHNDHYTVIVDEASAVDDGNHGVMRGALTHRNNRYIMTSQPTRIVGHFAEAFTNLTDIYRTLVLNSEESPLVSREWIREKLIEYGGFESVEYQIKVRGCFPNNLSGMLIPRHWCEESARQRVRHIEPWGWGCMVDVAEGVHRDSSTWTIGRYSGSDPSNRVVEVTECVESTNMDEIKFARELYDRVREIPNITICIDADGPGRTVILTLEELGMNVERIHWGLPPFSEADKKRFKNLRAYASVRSREAIFARRMRIWGSKRSVDQAARIPYTIDEKGRYCIRTKEEMRTMGIKSPDVFDTHCFFFLAPAPIPAEKQILDIDKITGITDTTIMSAEDIAKYQRLLMGHS